MSQFPAGIVIINAHHQNTAKLAFKVPLVPYIPAASIFCNINLMVHLSALTWIRFFIWMVIGMLMYFCYGIHHSREGTLGTSYAVLLSAGAGSKRGSASAGAGGHRGSNGSCDSADSGSVGAGSASGWGPPTKSRLGRIFERSATGGSRRTEDKIAICIDETADDS